MTKKHDPKKKEKRKKERGVAMSQKKEKGMIQEREPMP